MSEQGHLPILQDTIEANVWASWGAVWRDVYIVDPQGHIVGKYNLTEHDLSVPENRDALRQMLVDAAAP